MLARRWLVVLGVLCGALAVFSTTAESQQTILSGNVVDEVTGRPIVGAEVTVLRDTEVLGSGPSDPNGRYNLSFRVDGSSDGNLALRVDRPGYSPRQLTFQLVDGQPFDAPKEIGMLAEALSPCRSNLRHTIIIGNFRSPVGAELQELTERITDALQFDLIIRLQQNRLDPALQPVFAPCSGARPAVLQHSKRLVQALRADSLVYGDVTSTATPFTVKTLITDAYDLFQMPQAHQNDAVDLNDPTSAVMSNAVHAAILASLAVGIAQVDTSRCPDVISILNIIEQLVSSPSQRLETLRQNCTPHLANNQLLLN